MLKRAKAALIVGALAGPIGFAGSARANLVNPGFEYGEPSGHEVDFNDASINPAGGWFTTEADHKIEVWGSGFNGVAAYQGTDFVELNANMVGTLYQVTKGIASGETVGYTFAHRGRAGVDTMQLTITDKTTNTVLFSQQYSDGKTAWGFYDGQFTVAPGVASTDSIQFAYISVSSAGGNPTIGNFLDDADFGIGVAVPEPASFGLLGTGILGLIGSRRRRRT